MGKHKPPRTIDELLARARKSIANIDAHRAEMAKVAAIAAATAKAQSAKDANGT